MSMTRRAFGALFGVFAAVPLVAVAPAARAADPVTLLNVSYDISRELYKDVNPAFSAWWKAKTGQDVIVNQSHGGSSKQASSVLNGLEADVITMNQSPDIDILLSRPGLIAPDWREKFPNGAAPYSTVSVFIVRKGNPKRIRDWSDLTGDVQVIVPNPKTSGNGRYTYLAAWGYGLKQNDGDESKAHDFVKGVFDNVPILDGGGRGATTSFAQREIGDVLITFENESAALAAEFGADKFEVVYPSLTIAAPAPVAVVEGVARARGTLEQATGYLEFLYTPEAQEIIAGKQFRPSDAEVFARHAETFPPIDTLSVETDLGGWEKAQQVHFADGGLYDKIMAERR
ncbi:sulfate ABC transporter substrate-binding protein [Neomegalonema sp.]|uniref:sulfate ABC transporter substrate-binding protein n=1 Tax=Neomegalonema sp. TaxID=2039713 RepID=UPI002623F7D6|nr:sulfate ABC transporter substrate-binding protein [Neomegalonema sp.]MDD2869251.1 sulfate ABC transporter substrate-binding protein [Neomegalonema sp.]